MKSQSWHVNLSFQFTLLYFLQYCNVNADVSITALPLFISICVVLVMVPIPSFQLTQLIFSSTLLYECSCIHKYSVMVVLCSHVKTELWHPYLQSNLHLLFFSIEMWVQLDSHLYWPTLIENTNVQKKHCEEILKTIQTKDVIDGKTDVL